MDQKFEKALDDLATSIATDAAKKDIAIESKADALKTLTTYYLARKKVMAQEAGNNQPDDDGPSFEGFRLQMTEEKNGKAAVSGR